MAVPKIQNVQSKEYQMLFNWDISLSPLANVLINQNIPVKVSTNDLSQMFYQCETMDLPSRTFQMGEGNFRGVKIKQAGIPDFGGNTMTMVFSENIEGTVMDVINAWANLGADTSDEAYNNADGIWLFSAGPSLYKCNIPLYRLDSTRTTRVYGIMLVGCQYEGHDAGGGFDGASSDFVKPNLTVSFDAWYPISKGKLSN